MSLTAEGRHLIDALEAHLAAVKAVAAKAETTAAVDLEAAWSTVAKAFEGWEAKVAGLLHPVTAPSGEGKP
jgi:hypothetical protein